jgi:hypothetical protein
MLTFDMKKTEVTLSIVIATLDEWMDASFHYVKKAGSQIRRGSHMFGRA